MTVLFTRHVADWNFKSTITTRLSMSWKKTLFSLTYKEYDAILKDITAINTRLRRLVKDSAKLETSRRHRSRWQFTVLLRELSQSLFKALDGATARCCARHDVCLRLSLRDLEMEPGSVENQVATELDFHVALGLYNNYTATGGHAPQTLPTWYNILIKHAEDISQEPVIQGSQPEAQGFRRRLVRRTRATRALIRESFKLIFKPRTELMSMAQSPSGLGLCQMIKTQMRPATASDRVTYGFIQDRELQKSFGLYAPGSQNTGHGRLSALAHAPGPPPTLPTEFTLRQMLPRRSSVRSQNPVCIWAVRLGFQGTLQLAVLVSLSVLHLYSTPWLSKTITLDDIKFRLVDDASTASPSRLSSLPDFGPYFPYRPFISRFMPSSPLPTIPEPSRFRSQTRPWEMAAGSLGLVLIQLILGTAIQKLDISKQSARMMTFEQFKAICKLGERYESRLLSAAGKGCTSAVMWCLDSVVSIEDLHDENFCQEFCDKVICKLQDALEKSRRSV